jgi:predicted transcriptional regulator
MPRKKTGYIAFRPSEEHYELLQEIADKLDVSMNWLVNQALKEFIAKLPPVEEIELKLTKE